MAAPLLKSLLHTAALTLLITAFTVTSPSNACADSIFIFRNTGSSHQGTVANQLTSQKKVLLGLDENGDLLIQFAQTRFTVAYNAPSDLLKPSDQHQYPQFGKDTSAINGISLKASLYF